MKRRGAPKGGWKKHKEDQAKADAVLKGNSEFTLTKEMEDKAIATITAEDMALDRELDLIAKSRENVSIPDSGVVLDVQKPKENLEHLRAFVENYTPASSIAELTEQVHVAKSEGCDSIDGTPALVRQVFRQDYDLMAKTVGYGIYHDIRVYIAGKFDEVRASEKLTLEQRLHEKAKA